MLRTEGLVILYVDGLFSNDEEGGGETEDELEEEEEERRRMMRRILSRPLPSFPSSEDEESKYEDEDDAVEGMGWR